MKFSQCNNNLPQLRRSSPLPGLITGLLWLKRSFRIQFAILAGVMLLGLATPTDVAAQVIGVDIDIKL